MENQEAFMLETQHVSKHYGKLEVLKDINLQVKKGDSSRWSVGIDYSY